MRQELGIITQKVLNGGRISFEEAAFLSELEGPDILGLVEAGARVKEKFQGRKLDICSIINAKSGACLEDCAFCTQSSHYNTSCQTYPLIEIEKIVAAVKEAKELHATNFCIVTSGEALSDGEFGTVCEAIEEVCSKVRINMDCSLGRLTEARARRLRELGITRYNHNLETARSYFGRICTTHNYEDRLATVKMLKKSGIEPCSGGIIGLGESPRQRLELIFALRELDVNCVPVNILNPRPGTPLESLSPLSPMEIVKTIAVFRLVLPKAIIKLAGGREKNLRDFQALGLLAGANGFIIGGYLTTSGRDPKLDLQMLEDLGDY